MITTSNGIFFPNGFQLQFKRWCQKIKPLISFLKGIYTWNWKLPWVCCWSQTLVDNELNKVFLTEEFFRFIVLMISLDMWIESKFDNYSEWNIIVYDIGISRTVVQYLIIFRPLLTFGSEFKTTFFHFLFPIVSSYAEATHFTTQSAFLLILIRKIRMILAIRQELQFALKEVSLLSIGINLICYPIAYKW